MKRLRRVIEGLTTVSFGMILLANSAGVLSWRVWITLFSLWPLFLIVLGVEIIGKGAKQEWLRVISSLMVLGGLAWVVFVAPGGGLRLGMPWYADTEGYSFEESSARGISSASIDISLPLSSLELGDDRRGLVSIESDAPFEPEIGISRQGATADVTMETSWNGPVILFGDEPRAEVLLGRGTPEPIAWEVTVETGVVDCVMDLSELSIDSVYVDAALALLDVTLGSPAEGMGEVPVTIESGICDVSIRVPRDTEVRIEGEVGLGNVNVDSEIRRDGDSWESAGFDDADERFLIRAEGGIGSVDVTFY